MHVTCNLHEYTEHGIDSGSSRVVLFDDHMLVVTHSHDVCDRLSEKMAMVVTKANAMAKANSKAKAIVKAKAMTVSCDE